MSIAGSSYDLEFLDCLLEGEGGHIVMLKVYMDESGTHDHSPVINVGAYMGAPNSWKSFTKKWNKKKGGVKAYHAVDLHNGGGEFKDWDKPTRDKFVIGMLPIIAETPLIGVVCGIHMKAFNQHMGERPDLKAMFPSPYSACVQWTIMKCCQSGARIGDRNIAFVHELNDKQDEALSAFNYIQSGLKNYGFNISITFADKTLAPLQAADILAYEGNHMLREPYKDPRKPWLAIDPKLNRTDVSHYGERNMHELIKTLDQISRLSDKQLDGISNAVLSAGI